MVSVLGIPLKPSLKLVSELQRAPCCLGVSTTPASVVGELRSAHLPRGECLISKRSGTFYLGGKDPYRPLQLNGSLNRTTCRFWRG